VHLGGFVIRIYHEVRSPESQITLNHVQSNNLKLNQYQLKGNGTAITVSFGVFCYLFVKYMYVGRWKQSGTSTWPLADCQNLARRMPAALLDLLWT